MKLRFWVLLSIFTSSYFPLALIAAVQDFESGNLSFRHPVFTAGMLAAVMVCSLAAWLALYLPCRMKLKTDDVVITHAGPQSAELINYSLPYAVSFFAFDIDKAGFIPAFAIFMLILFILSCRTGKILMNPLFAVLGYRLYEASCISCAGNDRRRLFLLVKGKAPECGDFCRIWEIDGENALALATGTVLGKDMR